jgi:hypothetical protein
MRSVSAAFCANAGVTIATIMQVAGSAPRSQTSNRIYPVSLLLAKRRWSQERPPSSRSNPKAVETACALLPHQAVSGPDPTELKFGGFTDRLAHLTPR